MYRSPSAVRLETVKHFWKKNCLLNKQQVKKATIFVIFGLLELNYAKISAIFVSPDFS
jgi:hypothetical protein